MHRGAERSAESIGSLRSHILLGAILGAWQAMRLLSRSDRLALALGPGIVLSVGIACGALAGTALHRSRPWASLRAEWRALRWTLSWAIAAPVAALPVMLLGEFGWRELAFSPLIGAFVGFGLWVDDEGYLRMHRNPKYFLPLILIGVGALLTLVIALD